jgi:transcriptional regulator with XRE-family HTH domain
MASTAFAQRLRKQREAAGLSQYALAKRSGLSKQALSNLEAGSREPTWQTVQLLAAALGVDCRSFVDPALKPPEAEPMKPRGRPRKDSGQSKPAKRKGKRKS